jgi:hypothetical protein
MYQHFRVKSGLSVALKEIGRMMGQKLKRFLVINDINNAAKVLLTA